VTTAADILNGGGDGEEWVKIKDLVGDEITITGFKVKRGKFGKFPVVSAVDADGDEIQIQAGNHLIERLEDLEELDLFPVDVKVVTFPTDKGNPGYSFEAIE
jgi:hypothetical protein